MMYIKYSYLESSGICKFSQIQFRMRAGGSDATSTYKGLSEIESDSGLSHGTNHRCYWYLQVIFYCITSRKWI